MIEGRAVLENEGCIIGSKGREEGCISFVMSKGSET